MFSSDTTQVSDGGYQISRSLRFNSADSAYLNRTPASAGNRRTFTYSAWVKRSFVGTGFDMCLLNGYVDNSNRFSVDFANASNANLYILNNTAGTSTIALSTAALFRDPSAWYHVVVAIDTTQATSTNRVLVYVNGVSQTLSGTYPSQNEQLIFNYGIQQTIGVAGYSGLTNYFSGYQTEANFIDGSQLTPSSFGETNAQTGVWQPKAYAGSYGTNGFYLNFSDNSNTTAATLGKDYSGNGNNWTPNNFSVTAGAGNDSLVDSPTSYGTDTGVGGTVRGNYATLNPLLGSTATLSNGNLNMVVGTTATKVLATIGMSSGKWYWEYSYTDISGDGICGIATSQASITAHVGLDAYSWGYVAGTGNKVTNSSSTAYGSSYTTGDVIGVAFDADAGTLVFYKNGTSQGTAYSSLTSGPYFPAFGDNAAGSSSTLWANFGQRPFAYTAPSGYKALCTQNLPTPTIGATSTTLAGKYFNTVLYTGSGYPGSPQTITGVGFQPDWVWVKRRSAAAEAAIVDSVRAPNKCLFPSSTSAEDATAGYYVTAFTSDGFSVDLGSETNTAGSTYVGWNWKANGSGSTNTAGSITSTVSANTTSGFSVVTYTATGSNATVGHGLGAVPSMIIVKSRTLAGGHWTVYHSALGNTKGMLMNTTDSAYTNSGYWNNTTPTSTVFSIGTDGSVNQSAQNQVAYCFAEVAGYSKFGSYTGNASTDGPFCFCGFRPAYVMYKKAGGPDGDWVVLDVKRDTYNVTGKYLAPNASQAESNDPPFIDILSNGFKVRRNSGGTNENGVQYIFAAFAEHPFKYSLAR